MRLLVWTLGLTKISTLVYMMTVGDDVEIFAGEQEILLKKKSKPKFDLSEMISRMPRDYQVREESFGKPVGKEEW